PIPVGFTQIGSLTYTAPEILSGVESSSITTVYSFGMVLLGLIIWGEYDGHPKELLTRIDCPSELKELCLQCQEKKPAARPTLKKIESTLKQILFEFDQPTDSKLIKTDGILQKEIRNLWGDPEQEMKLARFACLPKDPQVLNHLFSALDKFKGF